MTRYIGKRYLLSNKLKVLAKKKNLPLLSLKDTSKLLSKNIYFQYKCEKGILSSCGHLRSIEARVKRPHKNNEILVRENHFHALVSKCTILT